MKRLLTAALVLFSLQAQGGEQAYTVRTTNLKAKPYSDAKTLVQLPEHRKVEVLKHQASWLQVKSDNSSGWVKMLDLRFESDVPKNNSLFGGLKSLFNVATTGSSGHTVTTGVRGLSEENIKNAQANPAELKRLQGYAASSGSASRFAGAENLKSRKVDYFPADEEGK